MNSESTERFGPSSLPAAVAPDGIAIHTFAEGAGGFAGVAEGRIPRGRFGIHLHLSLEQFTYVISGRVTAITGTAEQPDGETVSLQAGDLVLTHPGESLQFVNEHDEPARVLFFCAPPYPPDDADTRLVEKHGPLSPAMRQDAIARLEHMRAALNAHIDARIAQLSDVRAELLG